MKKFLTVALAGVLAASMLFTGCSKKEESKVPDKLIVGTNAEFPPFEYMNDKKQPDGFDIAMIKEIGKRMDKKVEIQNMEFKSLIGAMESESINTVIAGMTKTAEREESVDFSDSYYTSNQAIILKKDSKIKKLSQLSGKKIGVQEGTTGDIISSGEKFGEKNKVIVKKATVKRYKKGVDAVMDLKNGAIDAVVIDEKPAQEFVKNNAKKLKNYYSTKKSKMNSLGTSNKHVYIASKESIYRPVTPSMFQSTILDMAHVKNAAASIKGVDYPTIALETLLTLNPDMVIMPHNASYSKDSIYNYEFFSSLDIVKNKKIYIMPEVVESWMDPVPSHILASLWLSYVLHPHDYTYENYKKDVIDFYKEFYGFNLDETLITK